MSSINEEVGLLDRVGVKQMVTYGNHILVLNGGSFREL